jgi:hypothetical protein
LHGDASAVAQEELPLMIGYEDALAGALVSVQVLPDVPARQVTRPLEG